MKLKDQLLIAVKTLEDTPEKVWQERAHTGELKPSGTNKDASLGALLG